MWNSMIAFHETAPNKSRRIFHLFAGRTICCVRCDGWVYAASGTDFERHGAGQSSFYKRVAGARL
jgi:hypothetical protein